jgi:hypothetical protein
METQMKTIQAYEVTITKIENTVMDNYRVTYRRSDKPKELYIASAKKTDVLDIDLLREVIAKDIQSRHEYDQKRAEYKKFVGSIITVVA